MSLKNMLTAVNLESVRHDYAWYTVATLFNCEESYIRNLKDALAGTGLTDYVKEYFIPLQYEKTKESGKIKKRRGEYSGYVFVKCILTSDMWTVLRTTQGVAVVLTAGGTPIEISEDSVNVIRRQNAPKGFAPDELASLNKRLDKEFKCDNVTKPALHDSDFIASFS